MCLESTDATLPEQSLWPKRGRKSGIGERRLQLLVLARHISLHGHCKHPRELDDFASEGTRLCAALVGCHTLLASGTKARLVSFSLHIVHEHSSLWLRCPFVFKVAHYLNGAATMPRPKEPPSREPCIVILTALRRIAYLVASLA
jgi:hypothetical protein